MQKKALAAFPGTSAPSAPCYSSIPPRTCESWSSVVLLTCPFVLRGAFPSPGVAVMACFPGDVTYQTLDRTG